MSTTSNNIEAWSLGDVEVANLVCKGPYTSSGGGHQVYIPKLMPQVSMGKPKSVTVGLNKSCFCNDTKCKPSVATKVLTKNYFDAPAKSNRNFKHSLISHGARIEVDVRDKNPDNISISNKVDPSWDP